MQQTGIFAGRTEVRCPYARWGWTRGGGKVWHGGLDLAGLDDATIRMPYYKGKRSRPRDPGAYRHGRATRPGSGAIMSVFSWTAGQTPTPVNFLYFAHCASLLVKAGQRVASGGRCWLSWAIPAMRRWPTRPYQLATWRCAPQRAASGWTRRCMRGARTLSACTARAGRMQVITVGPVTQGDADAVLEVCRARGLVDAGLYRSEWRDA